VPTEIKHELVIPKPVFTEQRAEPKQRAQLTMRVLAPKAAPKEPVAVTALPPLAPLSPLEPKLSGFGAVFYMAHKWNSEIEKCATEIQHSALAYGLKFIIVSCPKIQVPSHFRQVCPTEQEVRQMYAGFISMWASNHFLFMWAWKHFGQTFDYIWSIEYDVRFVGNLNFLWTYAPEADYVSSQAPWPIKNTYYWYNSISKKWNHPMQNALKQVNRCSKRFLVHLDAQFHLGLNAQDELALIGHALSPQFTINNLGRFTHSTWSPHPGSAPSARKAYQASTADFAMFHPIK